MNSNNPVLLVHGIFRKSFFYKISAYLKELVLVGVRIEILSYIGLAKLAQYGIKS